MINNPTPDKRRKYFGYNNNRRQYANCLGCHANRFKIERPIRHECADSQKEQEIKTGQSPVRQAVDFNHSYSLLAGTIGVAEFTSAF